MIRKTRAERGLGKYDAPLRVQYQMGYDAFKYGRITNQFHKDTMQHREWDRGFNTAFCDNLKRTRANADSARSRTIPQGEV